METVKIQVPYECDKCDMIIGFYPGFTLSHLGKDRHGFTVPKEDD